MTPTRTAARPLIFACAALLAAGCTRSASAELKAPEKPATPEKKPAAPLAEKVCAAEKTTGARTTGNPAARKAAQLGLDFLARETVAWQARHQCYGCHVQAVTVEAMSVGAHHGYRVDREALKIITDGMLNLKGGARKPHGLSHLSSASLLEPAKSFGGAAFARFDQYVGTTLTDDLLTVAGELLKMQKEDGSVPHNYDNAPVATGRMYATVFAVRTWRQAHARTADDRWLSPIRKAEAHMLAEAKAISTQELPNLQELSYLAMGLAESGVGRSESVMGTLARLIAARQNKDGGWSFAPGQNASPFATGQATFALRQLGLGEGDRPVARGTAWLIEHQQKDGGWSTAGSGKAEAMWAVLGLVSLDVLSIDVAGIEDGQHVDPTHAIRATAADNQGTGVSSVRMYVDDVLVAQACGSKLEHTYDTKALADGTHLVDFVAKNADGKESRRQFLVYAGDTFMVEIGSRFSDDGTLFTLRNVAPKSAKGDVRVDVYSVDAKSGSPTKKDRVWRTSAKSAAGPMSFFWGGKNLEGKGQPKGRYIAELTYLDEAGKSRQSREVVFTHDTREAERNSFGEVYGKLDVDGEGATANTRIDLVDDEGNVVQSTWSTRAGQYRFKNVDKGKYKLRVKKEGFEEAEADIEAAPAAEAPKSMSLKRL